MVSTCPGPGAYKIPSFNDVPAHLSVCLLRGASNPRAVYSSKAVGEPPLFLAASVFYAIKVSFDWSGGHVTSVLISDWSRTLSARHGATRRAWRWSSSWTLPPRPRGSGWAARTRCWPRCPRFRLRAPSNRGAFKSNLQVVVVINNAECNRLLYTHIYTYNANKM